MSIVPVTHRQRAQVIKKLLLALSVLTVTLAGCGAYGTPQQAAQIAEATAAPTATMVPLTSTPLPPSPTATALPPAATATPLGPIPTADFTLDDITGTWTRNDFDRGQLYITIGKSGKYGAAHGTPDGVVHGGAYTLEGRVFTFEGGWDDCPAGGYLLRLATSAGKKYLYFDPFNDAGCADRVNSVQGKRWERYTPRQ